SHLPSLPALSTSLRAIGLRLNVLTSPVRSSTQPVRSCKRLHQTAPERRAECLATCSGPRNVHRRERSARCLRIPAKVELGLAPLITASRSRWRHSGRVEFSHKEAQKAQKRILCLFVGLVAFESAWVDGFVE